MLIFKADNRLSTGATFSPDGRCVATLGYASYLRLWSLADKPTVVREWGGSWGTRTSFSPDGHYLANGGLVRVRDVRAPDDEPVFRLTAGASDVLEFSPTGTEFAVLLPNNGLRRWAVPSWEPLPGNWDDGNPSGGMTYSPDGSLLVLGLSACGPEGSDSALQCWETATGQLRHELLAPFMYDHPSVLRFSPDGRLLAAIYGPILRVWDVANERELACHKTGKKHLKGLAWSLDGKRLFAVSNDTTVRQWVAPEWAEVPGFAWDIGKLVSLDASRDGCRMVAGSATGKVIVWDVD